MPTAGDPTLMDVESKLESKLAQVSGPDTTDLVNFQTTPQAQDLVQRPLVVSENS